MTLIKLGNIGIRFILELLALGFLGYWGFKTGNNAVTKIILGSGTPIVVAFVWGAFGSPAAPFPVTDALRLLLELVIYVAAASAFYLAGHPSLAIIFIIVALINLVLMKLWAQ